MDQSSMEEPRLFAVDSLFEAAEAEAGGPLADRDALAAHVQRYVDALVEEVGLSPTGTMIQQQKIHRLLVNRARFDADLARHPEILDEKIADPVVIVGLPRTGTTKLMWLLGEDPRYAVLPQWWLSNPAPFGPADRGPAGSPDPRVTLAREAIGMLRQMFPAMAAAHPVEAEAPDEDAYLQELTFQATAQALTIPAPRYQAAMRRHPQDEAYDYLHRILQYHQWQYPDTRGRPLVLKTPVHLGYLPLLLRHFERATVVHCHRDVAVSIPSLCRLFEAMWMMSTDDLDCREVGEWVVEHWADAAMASVEHRARIASRATVLDVGFEEIVHRPETVLRRVHEAHAMPGSSSAVVAPEANELPEKRYGKHEYSLQRYELDAGELHRRFAAYTALATTP